MAYKVSNLAIRAQAGVDNSLIGTWNFNPPSTFENYYYTWFYWTGDRYSNGSMVWITADSGTTVDRNVVYSPPQGAIRVTLHVIPASKTHEVNKQEVSYWQGALSVAPEYVLPFSYLDDIPTPEVDTQTTPGYLDITLGAISDVSGVDGGNDVVWFEIYGGPNGDTHVEMVSVPLSTGPISATYRYATSPGNKYRVRAQRMRYVNGVWRYSNYTDYTEPVSVAPDTCEIYRWEAESSTSVFIAWTASEGADSYVIEYTTDPEHFDISSDVTQVTVEGETSYIITGLESGDEYYFRVKAVNDAGESVFSDIVSVVVGKAPQAPTTWSLTTMCFSGERMKLYFTHNSEDNSRMSSGQLEFTINNGEPYTVDYDGDTTVDEDEPEEAYCYSFLTLDYVETTTVKWRVRTAGVLEGEYGPWSIMREFTIYPRAGVTVQITDKSGTAETEISAFPFYIRAQVTPKQEVLGYIVSVKAVTSYQTVDFNGEPKYVNAGDVIFTQNVNTKNNLLFEVDPSLMSVQENTQFTATVTASVESGLTAVGSATFTFGTWDIPNLVPTAQIGINKNNWTAQITPFGEAGAGVLDLDYTLAVYRREYDGELKELISGLDANQMVTFTDPHPPLDYARYRIVATHKTSGIITYADIPPYPVGGKSIVIQWDDEWESYTNQSADAQVRQAYRGSILVLPYNIDIQEDVSPDSELVSYVGREFPVSYYGSAVTSTATWNTDVPDYDTETLAALRRLQRWKGDCYVREPSGSGYWANLTVSFGLTHCERVIPVTINLTRVDGGI